jgi:predicted dehydrogenase
MVSYLTGLEMESLCARLETFGPGRVLDDNASILLNFKGGARGLFWSSQIAVGNDNGFRVRIFGTKASLDWNQEECNYVKVGYTDKPSVRLSRGRDRMSAKAQALSRIPSGHPEGYFEAFANLYSIFGRALRKEKAGLALTADDLDFPNATDGLRGVRFIEKCVESSQRGSTWVDF